MLILYATEITEDKHCGFRWNRPTTDHIICIRQIRQKWWNEAVSQLFLDFKKTYLLSSSN